MQKYLYSALNLINLTYFPMTQKVCYINWKKTQKFLVNSEFLSWVGALMYSVGAFCDTCTLG